MNKNRASVEDIQAYWNSRAGLGQWAGSRDVPAKQLEIEAIASHARDGQRILDVGCGNGVTAIELARRFAADVTGVDYASEMVTMATKLAAGQDLRGKARFLIGDVTSLAATPAGPYDLIYTERTLINLADWKTQKAAIETITSRLADGGVYAMCENSQDGRSSPRGITGTCGTRKSMRSPSRK